MHFTDEQVAELDEAQWWFAHARINTIREHPCRFEAQCGNAVFRLRVRDDRPFDPEPECTVVFSLGKQVERITKPTVREAMNEVLAKPYGATTIGDAFNISTNTTTQTPPVRS